MSVGITGFAPLNFWAATMSFTGDGLQGEYAAVWGNHSFVCTDSVQGKVFTASKYGKAKREYSAPDCNKTGFQRTKAN